VATFTTVSLLGFVPVSVAQAPALTFAEVLELRRQGVSSRQILRSARAYCLAFTVNDSIERRLDAVGADPQLVTGLRGVCSLAAGSVVGRTDAIFDDDYTHGGGRGGISLNDRRCSARADGTGLWLENRARDAVCVTGYPADPIDGDVRIELTVHRLGAHKLGLIVLGFGRDLDTPTQYSFSVTADRRVELCRTEGGACQRLVYKGGVAAINTGSDDTNLIAVEIHGRRMALIVNEVTVATYTANKIVTGALSLGVGPGTTVAVSRVMARRLSPPPAAP
jgi:hypothetical protein